MYKISNNNCTWLTSNTEHRLNNLQVRKNNRTEDASGQLVVHTGLVGLKNNVAGTERIVLEEQRNKQLVEMNIGVVELQKKHNDLEEQLGQKNKLLAVPEVEQNKVYQKR